MNDAGDVLEAVRYEPYGMMEEVGWINTPALAVREKFTGKEFDNEGSVNGASWISAYYFGARYYDPEVGVWLSCDKKHQFYSPYAYSTNPVLMVDKDGNFFWVPIIANALVSMALNAATQYIMIQSGAQEDFRWGSFVASGVSGALTSRVSQYMALGKLGANTFMSLMGRNLVNSAIDLTVRSIGVEWDAAHSKGFDKGKEYRNLLLSSGTNFVSNIGSGLANKLSGNAWEPAFERLKGGLEMQRNYGISSWADPYSSKYSGLWLEKTPFMQSVKNEVQNMYKWGIYMQITTITVQGVYEIYEYEQQENNQWDGTLDLPNQEIPR